MTNPLTLAIDPGSTSTKLALYQGTQKVVEENIRHMAVDLVAYHRVAEQLDYRLNAVLVWLEDALSRLKTGYGGKSRIDVVVARGGFLHPVASGVYAVNEDMLADLREARYGEHASNLGAMLAAAIAENTGTPAYIVDPIVVDEFTAEARIAGIPELVRKSHLHALNVRAVSGRMAGQLGKSLSNCNFVVAHLGSGVSVVAVRDGKMIDVNNANNAGPFAAERAGGLPTYDLIQLCFSGQFTERELLQRVTKTGGLYAYLGTKDLQEIERRVQSGDEQARLVLAAMVYQIAKEIGAMATVLNGDVQRIILTGGMAYSAWLTEEITVRVQFLAPVEVMPGEGELEALAGAGWRVLAGKEQPYSYVREP